MLCHDTRVCHGSHISRAEAPTFTFIAPVGFVHPLTRALARLLGPCFKTGRIGGRLSHRERPSALRLLTHPNEPPMARHEQLEGQRHEKTPRAIARNAKPQPCSDHDNLPTRQVTAKKRRPHHAVRKGYATRLSVYRQ